MLENSRGRLTGKTNFRRNSTENFRRFSEIRHCLVANKPEIPFHFDNFARLESIFATPFRAETKGGFLVPFNAQILTNFTYHMHYKQIKNIIGVHAYNRGRFSCWCTLDQTGDMIGTFLTAFSSRILFKIY